MRTGIVLLGILSSALLCASAFAAHPLTSDDTGTQGKGKFQLELNGEYGYDKEKVAGITTIGKSFETLFALSYGIADEIDAIFGVPFLSWSVKENGFSADESGISDLSLELKWRFFEKEKISIALKPGLTFPTGDEDKGLGTGKVTYTLFLIVSTEIEPFTLHLNLGYCQNENKLGERESLWSLSLATEKEITDNLKIVADIGAERNADRASNTHPAFAIIGVIYSLSEVFDIDVGVKAGLTKPETNYALLAGIAYRF
ncbi:MAG: transporter [Planctomycetota bacterium]|nr:transporter [Planctomycetota bacterium]